MTFIEVWIVYAICGASLFSAVFVWAVRAGQFTDFDRPRYMALDPAEPGAGEDRPTFTPLIDKLVWIMVVLVTLVSMISAVWIGYSSG